MKDKKKKIKLPRTTVRGENKKERDTAKAKNLKWNKPASVSHSCDSLKLPHHARPNSLVFNSKVPVLYVQASEGRKRRYDEDG